ncbi:hypothetical protein PINS_up007594 [Pythium insidiosum]|nr:hypothetical protein PINS_up007594 [Pythium insidiosum]
MGAQTSSALVPQEHFPPAIHTRFLRHRAVTLRLQRGFWSHAEPEPIEIRDVHTNLVMFRVPPSARTPLGRRRQRLLDMYNVPVATLLVVPQTYGRHHNAYVVTAPSTATASTVASSPQPHEELVLCQLVSDDDASGNSTSDVVRCVELPDPTTNELATISCHGHWRAHDATFWLQRAPFASKELIARVHSEDDRSNSNSSSNGGTYLLEIAPGVDVALLLLICAALDEEERSAMAMQPESSSSQQQQQQLRLRHERAQSSRRAPSDCPRIAVPA